MDARRSAFGDLLAAVETTSDEMDRRDAAGWLVVCVDLECVEHGEADSIVACYGPFATPEEALVEAGRHQETSLPVDGPGWAHYVKPLYGPLS